MNLFDRYNDYGGPVAIELFSSAWCNLDCKYCNIPKNDDFLLPKHRELEKEIIENPEKIIERIKKFYNPNKIEVISHWGTEPSLTFHKFGKFYQIALKEFPNLNTISLSSNFITNSEKMAEFIINFPEDRVFNFNIQMSLDGPSWITDKSRRQGSTNVIINNILKFYKVINSSQELKHKVNTHFKPTLSKEYFKIMDSIKLDEYYSFFNDLLDSMRSANLNNKINTSEHSIHFTIVCPQDYTVEDGKEFSSLFLRTLLLSKSKKYKYVQPAFSYLGGMDRLIKYGDEFYSKHRMFTCSAGDSQFGLNESVNPCHDTFYMNYEGYTDAMLSDIDRDHNEQKYIHNGSYKLTKKQLVCSLDNIKEQDDYLYRLRGFHDFAKHKISFSIAMIKLMAKCGQVSKVYKNNKWAELLAVYTHSRHSCLTQNQFYFGSMHINHPAYYKLFGNGLVENFVKYSLKDRSFINEYL